MKRDNYIKESTSTNHILDKLSDFHIGLSLVSLSSIVLPYFIDTRNVNPGILITGALFSLVSILASLWIATEI